MIVIVAVAVAVVIADAIGDGKVGSALRRGLERAG
jgi:hypothetical protein